MAESSNEGASAPGVAFAYDTAIWQIEKQEASIREVNARLGFVIAGVIAFAAWYFKDVVDASAQVWIGLPLFATVLLAAIGYLPRVYYRPPNPHGVISDANQPPGRMKELVLQNMLDSYDANARAIRVKGVFFTWALVTGVLAVLIGIGAEVAHGVIGLEHAGRTRANGRHYHRILSNARCAVEIHARRNGGTGGRLRTIKTRP